MTGGTEAEGWAEDLARAGESIWARKGEPVTVTHGEQAVNTAWETMAGARLAETHTLVRRDDLREVLRMACNCPEAMPVSPQEDAVLGRLSAAVEAGK